MGASMKMLKPTVQTLTLGRVKHMTPGTERNRAGWTRRRARILQDEPLCRQCAVEGRITAAREVDHIVPLWSGGSDDDSNLQPLCHACHTAKTAREAAQRGGGMQALGAWR